MSDITFSERFYPDKERDSIRVEAVTGGRVIQCYVTCEKLEAWDLEEAFRRFPGKRAELILELEPWVRSTAEAGLSFVILGSGPDQ